MYVLLISSLPRQWKFRNSSFAKHENQSCNLFPTAISSTYVATGYVGEQFASHWAKVQVDKLWRYPQIVKFPTMYTID